MNLHFNPIGWKGHFMAREQPQPKKAMWSEKRSFVFVLSLVGTDILQSADPLVNHSREVV